MVVTEYNLLMKLEWKFTEVMRIRRSQQKVKDRSAVISVVGMRWRNAKNQKRRKNRQKKMGNTFKCIVN